MGLGGPSTLDLSSRFTPIIKMSGVWGWFGGQSSQKKKDSPKNAILGLRSQLEMLQKRERHLQNQMEEQDAIARKNVSSNKNGPHPRNLKNSSPTFSIQEHMSSAAKLC